MKISLGSRDVDVYATPRRQEHLRAWAQICKSHLPRTPDLRRSLKLTPYRQINSRMVERDIYDGDPGLDRSGLWTKAKL